MECWVGGSFLKGLSGEVRDLNVGADFMDIWWKSLPGRETNKGNGPGKSVKPGSCDWHR